MGASFDITALGGIFSQVMEHQNRDIIDLWTQGIDPVLAAFEAQASKDGIGRQFVTRVEYDTGASASPSFAIAQALAQSTDLGSQAQRARWLSDASKIHALCVWDRDSMLAAVGDGPGETVNVIARERKAKIALVRHLLSICAVEAGWGRISTVSVVATGNHTFTVPTSEIQRFRMGMQIVFGATEDSGTLRGTDGTGVHAGYGNPWTVTGTDPASGTVTVSRGADHPYDTDGVRDGDTVFIHGSRQNTALPARICPIGLKGWIPLTAPTDTTFQGLDRRNIYQLNGLRLDASVGSLTMADALINGSMLAEQYDTEIDEWMVSIQDYATLIRDKDKVKTLAINVGQYDVGFDGVSVLGGKGAIKVVPSKYISQGNAWGGPFNNADFGPMLKHNGELVNTDNADGNEYLRLAGSDAYESRLYFRGCMVVPGPGKFIALSNLPSS